VFWLELALMMFVTAPFWWASKALPSLLDYRDRTDLPVLSTLYLCNTPACNHRNLSGGLQHITLVVTVCFRRTDCRKKMSGSFAQLE
jgi:hypothetical protein